MSVLPEIVTGLRGAGARAGERQAVDCEILAERGREIGGRVGREIDVRSAGGQAPASVPAGALSQLVPPGAGVSAFHTLFCLPLQYATGKPARLTIRFSTVPVLRERQIILTCRQPKSPASRARSGGVGEAAGGDERIRANVQGIGVDRRNSDLGAGARADTDAVGHEEMIGGGRRAIVADLERENRRIERAGRAERQARSRC